MLYIFIIATFIFIISKISKMQIEPNIIDELIKETHKYSGINEESYGLFYANIRLARENIKQVQESSNFLDKAIHHLNEIPLYMPTIDLEIQDDISAISQKIAFEFQRILIEEALNQNIYFKPKYI